MNKIKVNLDRKISASYEICIGHNIGDRIEMIIAKNNCASRYVVVTDSNVSALHGERFLTTLKSMGLTVDMIEIPEGETSKNINTVLDITKKLIKMGIDRKSALIALGGGVVGDVVGFVASIYMRGIPYYQIPTTLLAQVDSSIGGKTAIDLPEGKNLLGTFYQPKEVFIDLSFLDTLPSREFKNGMAEIIKYGIIEDTELFSLLESEAKAIMDRDMAILSSIIGKSCRIKKRIIEIDEKDNGLRRILNFGHTIGHAIEAQSDYSISHGDGVSIGMIAAARISEKLKHLSGQDREKIENLITTYDLPCRIPRSIGTEGIVSQLRVDKKKEGETVKFVLLKKLGMPFVNGGVSEAVIEETIRELKG
ncbi:MAG: 3-dehydroquinate synthase [Syntrophales bacterium]|nr:3-dehydroquinate synthase [Syntrophales bacterium]